MEPSVKYEVNLYLDGVLIGNVRRIAQNLKWARKRTRIGVDSISFTVNDYLLADWCNQRSTSVAGLLRPLALECRVLRNGLPVVGGFLATMPAYQPSGQSASLSLSFDGYFNRLANIYLYPQPTLHAKMGTLIQQWITEADQRASIAGKALEFKAGSIADMAVVDQSIENYSTIKDIITNRCDNETGAGPFEVYFHPDKTYDVVKDANFGETITDYIVQYPTQLNGVSATSMSAKELTGFASTIIGIGSGEVSSDVSKNTAPTSEQTNTEAVKQYGYAETLLQESSVSVQSTLDRNVATELRNRSTMVWQPQIALSGRQVAPVPTGNKRIWIGDTVKLQNNQDLTGMTSGEFRVNALEVTVDANEAEVITPTLSRGEAINTNSFARDYIRLRNEILALKTGQQ